MSRLRRWTVAACAACLAIFGGVITVRMASGEDPVLDGAEPSDGSGQTTPPLDRLSEGDYDRRPPSGAPDGLPFGGGGELPGGELGGGQEFGESGAAPVQPGQLRSGQS